MMLMDCGDGSRKLTKLSKVFLATVTIEAVLMSLIQIPDVVEEVQNVDKYPDELGYRISLLYSVLVIFGGMTFIYFAFDGILTENYFSIVAFLLGTVLLSSYAVFHYVNYSAGTTKTLLAIQLVFALILQILYIAFGYLIYKEQGWKVYQKVGKQVDKRTMYATYLAFVTLLKVDLQFQVVLVAQNLVLILDPDDPEFWANIVGLPCIVAVAVMGWKAIQIEHKGWTLVFLFLAIFPEPTYVIFRVYRLFTNPKYDRSVLPVAQLVSSAVLHLTIRLVGVVATCGCFFNFGNGLKELFEGIPMTSPIAERASLHSGYGAPASPMNSSQRSAGSTVGSYSALNP